MASIEMLRPYVEQQVAEVLGVEKVQSDPQGDIPIRAGSSVCVARLMDGPSGPMFRVFSPLLRGVETSAELMSKLNELNVRAPYVRFFHAEDVVYCGMDLLADNIQREEIDNAIAAISYHADHLDDLLQKEFGGERMLEDSEVTKPPGDPAGYL